HNPANVRRASGSSLASERDWKNSGLRVLMRPIAPPRCSLTITCAAVASTVAVSGVRFVIGVAVRAVGLGRPVGPDVSSAQVFGPGDGFEVVRVDAPPVPA